MKKILFIAPHPDDETLGCGGTILRHKVEGDEIYWLLVTCILEEFGFTSEAVSFRKKEIETIAELYSFNSVYNLELPTTRLESLPITDLIEKMSSVFRQIQPEVIYLPYRGDIHTDHKVVFDAAVSCTKWFRYGSVKQILAYETLSETDFEINPESRGFRPNVFVDITLYLDKKIDIMKVYKNELGQFPFPRSPEAIRSLALFRGAIAGCNAAEAFMLLKEIK
ncbi:MAG: PIG-L family deacetylase [Alphaproteobacteria bacterium]|uniref:PIG-L family deacetylase n=1 Tax=Candidatus Nitrobium versatile TaxID=2884831 RepID=A0A953JDL3_9BACT|nr:PIG-L family deacetylase [Candidatus Nitrobium versatile]